MAATEKRVDIRDLADDAAPGSLWGRWEFSNADGEVEDRWQPARTTDSVGHGWGMSWNNACSTTGPRATYRLDRLEERTLYGDPFYPIAVLICVKAERAEA